MKIGLFFGSFNPIHNGHLIIANQILNHTDCKKIWFVVSPQNPLKEKESLLNQYDRLHMVNLAIENNPSFKSCDVEFKLPLPSYTIDTLQYLNEKYPQHHFSLIMGSDNLNTIHKWKNYETLLKYYTIFVYKRGNATDKYNKMDSIKILDFPFLDISSTYIRQLVREKKSVRYFLPDTVDEYIRTNQYYKVLKKK
jgi:nicotinate-nucleotide adenylyltransferase